jgi:hypothetical protein
MTNQIIKRVGNVCIIVFTLCMVWVMIGMAYAIPSEARQYRFDGVYAAEGTVFTVKGGKLVLIGGSSFAVDQPIRRIINLSLWGMCCLTTLISGIVLLRLAKHGPFAGTNANEVRISQTDSRGVKS